MLALADDGVGVGTVEQEGDDDDNCVAVVTDAVSVVVAVIMSEDDASIFLSDESISSTLRSRRRVMAVIMSEDDAFMVTSIFFRNHGFVVALAVT